MLPPSHRLRRHIPFYAEKSESDFRSDPYEDYATVVCRQLSLHYADDFHGGYPWQPLLDWTLAGVGDAANILEIGCGVGRMIGELALAFPAANCYGFDYSYQLLKAAHDIWLGEKKLEWAYPRGYPNPLTLAPRRTTPNLQLGLAKAAELPFPNDSLDLIYSTFLFDRLPTPAAALLEWQRVLKPGGTLRLATPLNFQAAQHWNNFYPAKKLRNYLQQTGWEVATLSPPLLLQEPLDVRGNKLLWKCALVEATVKTAD